MINWLVAAELPAKIGTDLAVAAIQLAKAQDKIEDKWIKRVEIFYRDLAEKNANHLLRTGRPLPDDKVDFDALFVEHWFDVHIKAARSLASPARVPARMARPPTKIQEILKLYELWRRKKIKPKAPAKIAKGIKAEYLKKIHAYWRKHSEDFLSGEVYSQAEAKKKLVEDLDMSEGRAKTVIRTETTRYYNKVRKDYYDAVPDVTHYLFVALRDMRTTKWCKTRDGLIYEKGKTITDKESPPCHFNCRSEFLPLDPDNPNHRRLIGDKGIRRENRTPEPLPRGWKRA